jgi:phosphoribosylanthranilate isomerase
VITGDNSVWVKICGITRPEDAVLAATAGADAIGINRISRSPRCVTDEKAAELAGVAALPAVVLVEDMDPKRVVVYLDELGADGVQPYGANAVEVAAAVAEAGWVALLPTTVADAHDLPRGVTPLVDTPDATMLGGTGRTFEWSAIDVEIGRFVLAGGLGPDNVAEAVHVTGAWGVDASSRLEVEVGVKDVGKVTAFVREAKQA